MGLLTALLTLPLAPVRGVAWIADQMADMAQREVSDPAVLRVKLAALNADFEAGLINEDEFEREEERLLTLMAERPTNGSFDQKATHRD